MEDELINKEFEELVNSLDNAMLVCIVATFPETDDIRKMLIDCLSEGDKECVLDNHKIKKVKPKVEVIRGIPAFVVGRDSVKRGIVTPNDIYDVSKVYTKTYTLSKKHKVIGVVTNKVFKICYDIRLTDGQTAFGYFVSNTNDSYQVQTIEGFNKFSYEPYQTSYTLGKVVEIKCSEIKEALYQFKDLFYSEFK